MFAWKTYSRIHVFGNISGLKCSSIFDDGIHYWLNAPGGKKMCYTQNAITGHVILKGNYNVHRMNNKLFVLTESSDVRSAG